MRGFSTNLLAQSHGELAMDSIEEEEEVVYDYRTLIALVETLDVLPLKAEYTAATDRALLGKLALQLHNLLTNTQPAATRRATEPQQSDRRQRRPRYKPIYPVETAPLAAVISILIQRHRAIPDVRQRALALHFLVDATPIGEVLLFITENSNEIFLDTTLPAATEEHPEQHVRGGFELEQAVALGGIWWKFVFSWPSQVRGLMQALNPSDGSGSSAGARAGVGKANGVAPSVVPASALPVPMTDAGTRWMLNSTLPAIRDLIWPGARSRYYNALRTSACCFYIPLLRALRTADLLRGTFDF